jgi:hypothetical protein
MGLLGPSRQKRGPDPYIEAKIFLFLAGAVLAAAGMITGRTTLVWLAFLPLGAVALLRFLRPRA